MCLHPTHCGLHTLNSIDHVMVKRDAEHTLEVNIIPINKQTYIIDYTQVQYYVNCMYLINNGYNKLRLLV